MGFSDSYSVSKWSKVGYCGEFIPRMVSESSPLIPNLSAALAWSQCVICLRRTDIDQGCGCRSGQVSENAGSR